MADTTINVTYTLAFDEERLSEVFVTACEGGINYWAQVDEYDWTAPGTAVLSYENEQGEPDKRYITSGLVVVAAGLQRAAERGLTDTVDRVHSGDYDAADADAIIQLAVFDDVIYG